LTGRRALKKDARELEARIREGSRELDDFLLLGKHYFDAGEYSTLVPLYERALELPLHSIDRATIHLELGRALETLGQLSRALEHYRTSLDTLSGERESALVVDISAMCHYNLAVNIDIHDEAVSHAEEALGRFAALMDRYPGYGADKGALYSHMGELYMMLGNEEEALLAYKLSHEYSRDNEGRVWSLNGIAMVYKRLGRPDEAETYFRQALGEAQNRTQFSKNYYDLGEVLDLQGRYRNALEAFQKALDYRDDDPVLRNSREYLIDIFWYLGDLSYREAELEDAAKYLNKVASLVEESHRLYCNTHITLGHCYVEMGNPTRGAFHYNKALFSPVATQE
jgi:tetratricopeptide (TPR) repeat protein